MSSNCPVAAPTVRSCSGNWQPLTVRLDGLLLCYVFNGLLKFDDAKNRCTNMRGFMSKPYSSQVDSFLEGIVLRRGTGRIKTYYVGIHRQKGSSTWRYTADNTEFRINRDFNAFDPALAREDVWRNKMFKLCAYYGASKKSSYKWNIRDCAPRRHSFCFRKGDTNPTVYVNDKLPSKKVTIMVGQKITIRCTMFSDVEKELTIFMVNKDGKFVHIPAEPLQLGLAKVDGVCMKNISVAAVTTEASSFSNEGQFACTTGKLSDCENGSPYCSKSDKLRIEAGNYAPVLRFHYADRYRRLYAGHQTKITYQACLGPAGGLDSSVKNTWGIQTNLYDTDPKVTTTTIKRDDCDNYRIVTYLYTPSRSDVSKRIEFSGTSYSMDNGRRVASLLSTVHVQVIAMYPEKPKLEIAYPARVALPVLGLNLTAECSGCLGNFGSLHFDLVGSDDISLYSKVVAVTTKSYPYNQPSQMRVSARYNCRRYGSRRLFLHIVEEINGARLRCWSAVKNDKSTTVYSEPFDVEIPSNTKSKVKFMFRDSYQLFYADQSLKVECEACVGKGGQEFYMRYGKRGWKRVYGYDKRLQNKTEKRGNCKKYEILKLTDVVDRSHINSNVSVRCSSVTHYWAVEVNRLDTTATAKIGEYPSKPLMYVHYHKSPNIVYNGKNMTANCSACVGTIGDLVWELRDPHGVDMLIGYPRVEITSFVTEEDECHRFGYSHITIDTVHAMNASRLICFSGEDDSSLSAFSNELLVKTGPKDDGDDDDDDSLHPVLFVTLYVLLVLIVLLLYICYQLACQKAGRRKSNASNVIKSAESTKTKSSRSSRSTAKNSDETEKAKGSFSFAGSPPHETFDPANKGPESKMRLNSLDHPEGIGPGNTGKKLSTISK